MLQSILCPTPAYQEVISLRVSVNSQDAFFNSTFLQTTDVLIRRIMEHNSRRSVRHTGGLEGRRLRGQPTVLIAISLHSSAAVHFRRNRLWLTRRNIVATLGSSTGRISSPSQCSLLRHLDRLQGYHCDRLGRMTVAPPSIMQ